MCSVAHWELVDCLAPSDRALLQSQLEERLAEHGEAQRVSASKQDLVLMLTASWDDAICL
jgi:hypothetical protein